MKRRFPNSKRIRCFKLEDESDVSRVNRVPKSFYTLSKDRFPGIDDRTNLFVVKAGRQREHAGARIQRKNVVGPVGNQSVAELTVGPVGVCVSGDDLTYSAAPWHVLRHVERIRGALERRRIVVGVGHL